MNIGQRLYMGFWVSVPFLLFRLQLPRDCSPMLLGLFILLSVNLSYIWVGFCKVVCEALVRTVGCVYNYVHIGCSMVYLGNIRIIFDFEGQL
jgi:hypothetical protein